MPDDARGQPDKLTTPVAADQRFLSARFPRASRYHPRWVVASASSGANSLWLAEWLAEAMEWQPGMRVLDLGCGRAMTSIFLAREFDVQVWATDLWLNPTDNLLRIRDAGVADRVFPLHCDARALPFAAEFFDAITCVDCYNYFGTDELYLNYLANFVPEGGQIGIAGAALAREIDGDVPAHLHRFWSPSCWSLHSAAWWRRLWEKTGIVDVETADTMPDGWQAWLDWHLAAFPENRDEIETLQADRGEYLGYARVVARRRPGVTLEEYCWPDTMRAFPREYTAAPLLRET